MLAATRGTLFCAYVNNKTSRAPSLKPSFKLLAYVIGLRRHCAPMIISPLRDSTKGWVGREKGVQGDIRIHI